MDTGIYVTGQRVPCPRCGIRVEVVRGGSEPGVVAAPSAVIRPQATAPARPRAGTRAEDETFIARRPSIPGYELVEMIGRGGMGEVWRAVQLSLGRTVAVKLLA